MLDAFKNGLPYVFKDPFLAFPLVPWTVGALSHVHGDGSHQEISDTEKWNHKIPNTLADFTCCLMGEAPDRAISY
jgi:hypothetical protein